MCEIVVIANASKVPDFQRFTRHMSASLQHMQDGFGYAARGASETFGVRTTDSRQFILSSPEDQVPEWVVRPQYEVFGDIMQPITGPALFHGRVSTNTVSLLNTHPIARSKWHLIHNGVVTHHGLKYIKGTTNDSEDVLYNFQTGGIDLVAKNLSGYYACGVIDPTGKLYVFRDSIAPLVYAYSKKLGTHIFATNQALLNAIGAYIDERLCGYKVQDDTMLKFSATGDLLSTRSFKSRGFDTHSRSLAHKSLGHKEWGPPKTTGGYVFNESNRTWTKVTQDETTDDGPLDDDTYPLDVSLEFLDEIELLDDTYRIMFGMREISVEEFRAFSATDQINCTIWRRDGSIVPVFDDEDLEAANLKA